MNLTFSSFVEPGNIDKERLILKAAADLPLGDYLVMLSKISDQGSAYSGMHTAFWFPDGDVKSGDLIVVYTKSGTVSKKTLDNGSTARFFYWGLSGPIWAPSEKQGVVIVRSAEWKFSPSK